jgi:hypothetical protein
MFLCTTLNSPVTLTVAGQFKAVAQTMLGLIVFGGVKIVLLACIFPIFVPFMGFIFNSPP